jgi:hypothetical protein
MKPIHAAAILAAGIMAIEGCSDSTAAEKPPIAMSVQPELATDSSAYTATPLGLPGPYRQFGFDMTVRFTNLDTIPVYLDRCTPVDSFPMYGFAADSVGPDGMAYDPVWACVGHDSPIEVAPRSTRIDHYHVVGPWGWTFGGDHEFGDFEGRLQLVYPVTPCRHQDSCELPGSSVLSNYFVVRVDSL